MRPAISKPVTLRWGETFVAQPNQMMGIIATIEEHLTLHEMQKYAARGAAPIAKLSMAYAAVLTHLGAKDVTPEAVYSEIVTAGDSSIPVAIAGLLKLMVPPTSEAAPATSDTNSGNVQTTVAKSTKRRTKQRSETIGG